GEDNPEKRWHFVVASPANYLDWRAGVSDFQDAMAYVDGVGHTTLTGQGDPQLLAASYVTGNFFSTLGVRAAMGRTFHDEETWQSSNHVVVLSDAAWRSRFGSDPSIVGKSITLDGRVAQVVGVMPAGFSYPRERVDVWQPI